MSASAARPPRTPSSSLDAGGARCSQRSPAITACVASSEARRRRTDGRRGRSPRPRATAMMNEVAPETPNASRPSQMITARPIAQRPAWTPWIDAGGTQVHAARMLFAGGRAECGQSKRPEEVQAPPRAISPNRFRFRPLPQPAFGFRLRLPGAASTYSRSVLGASGNLEGLGGARKSSGKQENPQFARSSVFHISTAFLAACDRRRSGGAGPRLRSGDGAARRRERGSFADLRPRVKSDPSDGRQLGGAGLGQALNLT